MSQIRFDSGTPDLKEISTNAKKQDESYTININISIKAMQN